MFLLRISCTGITWVGFRCGGGNGGGGDGSGMLDVLVGGYCDG